MAATAGDLRGTTLGRFRILDLLGRGGMGDVYRARDESLGRDVAVKVLPADLTGDAKRVERFMQEARAASALNHPHLTTVYEIGSEPFHYIAMELVPGRTLRTLIDSERPPLPRVLDWILQIADALGAAHDAGVVHRDIKPENLMITGDGYAKVLDFGVAKLRADGAELDSAATRVALTEAGVMVGTSGYMSPEQARGRPTDRRTDVFALGCVLYEGVSGSRAFDAPSAVERLHRVINDEPRPIAPLAPEAPLELVSAVRKCLAKDPDDRYQSMKDLAIDLRYVRRLLETATSPAVPGPAARFTRLPVWGWLVGAALIAAAVLISWRSARRADVPAAPIQATVQRLTTSGGTVDAVISPDGRFLAHMEAVGSNQTLWIRSLENGQDRLLVPAGSFAFYGLRFTPDGKSIAFTARGSGFAVGRLSLIPVEGGTPRVLLTGILTPVVYSPDGRQLAFLREHYPDQDSSALIVANADGTAEKILATRHTPDSFTPAFFTSAAWSPDGAHIVAASRNATSERAQLLEFDARSGAERELHNSSDDITFSEWLPDGAGIVYVSRAMATSEAGGSTGQLWLKPYPSGAPRRITTDLTDYRKVSIAGDGKTLVAIGAEYEASIFSVPLDGSPPRRIRSERYDGLQGVNQLADGSLILSALVGSRSQIMHLSADGATRTVLTTEGLNTFPAVSPDGSVIAMVSIRGGSTGVWRMRMDGSDQRLLTALPAAAFLSITADGRRVIAMSYKGAVSSVWSVPLDGGQAVEIARQMQRATVSPDGQWLAGVYEPANVPNSEPSVAVMPLDGSSPLRMLGPIRLATATGIFTWARDGSGIIASTNERFNLYFYSAAGGPRRQLTSLADLTFIRGALAPDGESIVASRGIFNRDVYTIKGFTAAR
jgi:Tol biopolymer transport system component